MKTLEQRFWEKVDIRGDDECWNWKANKIPQGYGYISVGNKWKGTRKELRTHRVSYELSFGEVPLGLVVKHKCDNPSCVNPRHLEAGTQKSNIKEMVVRGRQKLNPNYGAKNHATKLSELTVQRIRIVGNGLSIKTVAKMLNVSDATVAHIRTGRNWPYITSNKQALA